MNVRNLPTRIATALVLFLVFGRPMVAKAATSTIPVGHMVVTKTWVGNQTQVNIAWSAQLPKGANPSSYSYSIKEINSDSVGTPGFWFENQGTLSTPLNDPAGGRFELWASGGTPVQDYLLDSAVVLPYSLPAASVTIHSEDPYALVPRTRADRTFSVDVTVQGILSGESDPTLFKSVNLTHHVQSYGATGTGSDLDRTLATVISTSSVTTNGTETSIFVNSIPAVDVMKVRGEERFTISTVEGEGSPATVLSSKFIQIWPVADGSITGINNGQIIGADLPAITVRLHDLYPRSDTYVQVYKGNSMPAATGTLVPGSLISLNDSVPSSQVLTLGDYGSVFNSDGIWTMEVLTQTPFGTDRLASVSFTVHRFGTPLDYWRETHFGSTNNTGDGADLNDFDHDGIPNIAEFAFGSDPKKNSARLLPKARVSGNNLVIDFTQPEGVSGITYGAEWSTTLLPDSWVPVSDTGTLSQHLFSVPIDAKPQLFMRLKVTK